MPQFTIECTGDYIVLIFGGILIPLDSRFKLSLSRFVIHRQLLPSHSPEIPCRPSKGVPSERLRLVKWFISHRLHTGACVNLVLLTYLLTYLKTSLLDVIQRLLLSTELFAIFQVQYRGACTRICCQHVCLYFKLFGVVYFLCPSGSVFRI